MSAISRRRWFDHSATSNRRNWERVIDGTRYWFNATPFEMKVFRLRLDGGDLVHHWKHERTPIREAIARDSILSPEETAVKWATCRWLTSCKGFDTITGERCHHPICNRRNQHE